MSGKMYKTMSANGKAEEKLFTVCTSSGPIRGHSKQNQNDSGKASARKQTMDKQTFEYLYTATTASSTNTALSTS